MRYALLLAVGLSTLPAGPLCAQTKSANSTELKTLRDKASYSIGLSIGERFSAQLIDPNLNALLQGIKDGMTGGQKQLSEQQVKAVMEAYDKEITAKLRQRNMEEGSAFLAANKKKQGVKVAKSGLQYKVLREGKSGPKPNAKDTIAAHYRGTLVGGQEFDNSYRRGEPLVIGVAGVIPGWTEALQMMTVGAKWQLVIPPELAYGEDGFPPAIGPNATLIFEMELMGIEQPESLPLAEQPRGRPAADKPKISEQGGSPARTGQGDRR